MRIALDGLPLSYPLTGVGHYTLELARHLASSETDEVYVVSPQAFLPSVNFNSHGRPNLHLIRATVNPLTRHWWSIGAPGYLKRNKVEIFHGTNFEVPLRGQGPALLTIHDLSMLLYPETQRRRQVRRLRRRLPLMARRATMIITPTDAVRREVHDYLQIPMEKIIAVPEAARDCFRPLNAEQTYETRRRLGISDEFLLYVGTVEPRKNLLTLVRAFEEVLRRRQNRLQLVIAGQKGWLVDALFKYVSHSPARQRILFTGYLSDTDLCSLYSSCTALIYPSLYEGFGLPPLEAMACGAPVIASRLASIMEVVGSAARLIEPQNASALAEALLQVLADNSLREGLSSAGRAKAQEFSWAETARRMRDVYQEAIERFARS